MAGWDDVRRLAMAMPDAEERISRELRQWRVADKLFVWERPLRRKEVEELGERAPAGSILGAKVEHLLAREALLADAPEVFFTTSHFTNHPSVLVRLEPISLTELDEVVTEAWLVTAPARLADAYLERRGD